VTDANLILGRLSETGLLDGAMPLRRDLAEAALRPAAERVGLSLETTALGLIAIAVANMTRSVRRMSVERGRDPREFALMAFGGAGALHARDVAAELGMTEVLVPPAPGIVCAEGLLVSDQKEDFVQSLRLPLAEEAMDAARKAVGALAEAAAAWFAAERLPTEGRMMELALDLRYVGQNFELITPVAAAAEIGPDDLPAPDVAKALFFAAHDRAYGFHDPEADVEIVNFRMTARGRLYDAPPLAPAGEPAAMPAPVGRRPVWFDRDGATESPVYRREALKPGLVFEGPAIVDQMDATTPVFPEDRVEVRPDGSLLITLKD